MPSDVYFKKEKKKRNLFRHKKKNSYIPLHWNKKSVYINVSGSILITWSCSCSSSSSNSYKEREGCCILIDPT